MIRTLLPTQIRALRSRSSVIFNKRSVKMAAFSDPSFDFKGYLENRPRYPDQLYNTILSYHNGSRDTVLDLGCGPGLSLFPFAYHFKTLIGVDPSEGMIREAQGAWQAWKKMQQQDNSKDRLIAEEANFSLSSAEDLKGIADSSVDLVTAATAAHWFDYPKLWPELARVLRRGGTAAFWTYGSNYLPQHPDLAPMMLEFMNSQTEKLGPYWPQPGRSILESLLADVPFPSQLGTGEVDIMNQNVWDDDSETRIAHKLASTGIPDLSWTRGEAPEEAFRMEQVMTFYTLNGYFHTSSASSRYFKAFPDLKKEKPDMIDRHAAQLRQKVLEQRAKGLGSSEGLDEDHVRVAWPMGLMMIRKKE